MYVLLLTFHSALKQGDYTLGIHGKKGEQRVCAHMLENACWTQTNKPCLKTSFLWAGLKLDMARDINCPSLLPQPFFSDKKTGKECKQH